MKHNTKNTGSKSRVRVKIWVEHDGNMIMSDYLADLLVKIDETNSIKKAAELLDLPYRTALKKIQEIENSKQTKEIPKGEISGLCKFCKYQTKCHTDGNGITHTPLSVPKGGRYN